MYLVSMLLSKDAPPIAEANAFKHRPNDTTPAQFRAVEVCVVGRWGHGEWKPKEMNTSTS